MIEREKYREILLKLLDEEWDEDFKKAIIIDSLGKSRSLIERRECFFKINILKTEIRNIKGFLEDIFFHESKRIKIEEELNEELLGEYMRILQEILYNTKENISFLGDLVYKYFVKIKHEDKIQLKQKLVNNVYNLPEEIREEVIRKLNKIILMKKRERLLQEEEIPKSIRDVKKLTIFITYSHKDKSIANRLENDLKVKNVNLCIDKESIKVGKIWIQEIDKILSKSNYVLAIMTKNYLSSFMGKLETYATFVEALKRKDILWIPLFFESIEDLELTPLLRSIQGIDLFENYEEGIRKLIMTLGIREGMTQKKTTIKAKESNLIVKKWEEVLKEINSNKKGRLLEDVIRLIMQSIFGNGKKVTVNRKTRTEEIDIVIRNEIDDGFWKKQCSIILCECKYWSKNKKVGKNELVTFKEKIENRRHQCKIGFLISINDFTNTFEEELLRSSKTDIVIVAINKAKVEDLIFASPTKCNDLLKKYTQESILT